MTLLWIIFKFINKLHVSILGRYDRYVNMYSYTYIGGYMQTCQTLGIN